MNNTEATQKFQLSQSLFDEKRYVEALAVLDELALEFPGQKNVLFPRARCLYKLGVYDDAASICRILIDTHMDPRAMDLFERIQAKQASLRAASPSGANYAAAPPSVAYPANPPGVAYPVNQSGVTNPVNPPGVAYPANPFGAAYPADPSGVTYPPNASSVAYPVNPAGAAYPVDPSGMPYAANPAGAAYPVNPYGVAYPAQPQAAPIPQVPVNAQSSKPSKRRLLICVCVVIVIVGIAVAMLTLGPGPQNESATTTGGSTPDASAAGASGDAAAGSATAPAGPARITWLDYDLYSRGEYDQTGKRPKVFFFTSNSEDCKKMEERVLGDVSIISLTDGWLFVRVDAVRMDLAKVCREIRVSAVVKTMPTVIILASTGQVVYRQEGVPMVRDLYTALMDLNLQVELPVEATEAVQVASTEKPPHISWTGGFIIFAIFVAILYFSKQDSAGSVLYAVVFAGVLFQYGAATQFAGILPGIASTPDAYIKTGLHVYALTFALLALTLDAYMRRDWSFAILGVAGFAVIATYFFASMQWERLDFDAVAWKVLIKPALILNSLFGIPAAIAAHRQGEPSAHSLWG